MRHAIHHFAPHALGSQSSDLGSGNRLHIGCYPFFDPVMALLNGWKTEMNHLVGQHPVAVEFGLSDMLTHRDPASRSGFTETHPVGDASALRLKQPYPSMRHREPVEVRRRGPRRLHHPVQQGGLVDIELVGIEGNVDCGLADFKARR